jgi:hypothetical protein
LTNFSTYAITETAVSGWDLTDISCAGGSFTPNLAAGAVTIALDPGEDITCTFENSQRGSITIVKDALPNHAQNFSFTGDLGSFTLDDDGGQDNPISNTITFSDLPANTYLVDESSPSGWDLTGISCVGGDFTPNLGAGNVSIALDPGENITCTFENTKESTIRVVKDTVPDNTQSFSFILTDDSGSTPFSLVDDGTPPNSQDFIVPSGNYTVTEAIVSGWDLTDIACTEDTVSNSSEDTGTRTANIILEVGETVTCVFTNTVQPGSITIVKDAVPDSDQAFFYSSAQLGPFTLDDDGTTSPFSNTITFPNLAPGPYTVSEIATAGWSLSGLTCNDPTANTTTGPGAQANIAVGPGENITCTFTNTSASSSITIIKNASPLSTQPFTFTGALGSFTLTNDGVSANFRTFFLPAGTYAVSETAIPGWNLTGLSCVDLTGGTTTDLASGTATIGLANGENVACTFNNQQVSPPGTGDIFLPIIFRGGAAPACTDIDLQITNISVNAGVVTVVIQNTGSCPTDSGFWVDLYANIQGQQPANLVGVTGDRRWNSPQVKADQGLAWSISGLNAGASLTLTSDGSSGPPPQFAVWPPPPGSPITAYVDSFDSNDANNATFVEIQETNETNNQATIITFTGGLSASAAGAEPASNLSRPDLD